MVNVLFTLPAGDHCDMQGFTSKSASDTRRDDTKVQNGSWMHTGAACRQEVSVVICMKALPEVPTT